MRSALLPASIVTLILMAFSGCAGTRPVVQGTVTPTVPKGLEAAPAWVFAPTVEGEIAAVGSAPMGKAGEKSSRNLAIKRGRDELAQVLNTKVQDMLRSFMETTGIGDKQTMDKVAAHAAKQVAENTLAASRVKEVWYQVNPVPPATRPSIFVWVVLDSKTAMADLRQVVMADMRKERALWQEFEAQNASEELDRAIEREFAGAKSK